MLLQRKIIKELEKYVDDDQIIVVHGARQVGKTSVMEYMLNKLKNEKIKSHFFFFDLEDRVYLDLLNQGVEQTIRFLKEKGIKFKSTLYLFIDEIQYLDDPSNFLKLIYDRYKGNVKLIVSGSSSFDIKSKFKDSLVGRTIDFELHPLDFEEFLLFKSKKYILSRSMNDAINKELCLLYKEFVRFGGYPQIVLTDEEEKKYKFLNQIINTYIRKDIRDLANIKNIDKFNKLIEILSAQSGNLINIQELSNTTGLARKTINEYLFILENTYIIKLLNPFSSNLRSELFKMPKIYFYDTGLMHLLFLKGFPNLISGESFETSMFGEFVKNLEKNLLFFWRTKDKKEIDFIYSKNNKTTAIEIKTNIAQFRKTAFSYFNDKYPGSKNYGVFLEGVKKDTPQFERKYPWEVVSALSGDYGYKFNV